MYNHPRISNRPIRRIKSFVYINCFRLDCDRRINRSTTFRIGHTNTSTFDHSDSRSVNRGVGFTLFNIGGTSAKTYKLHYYRPSVGTGTGRSRPGGTETCLRGLRSLLGRFDSVSLNPLAKDRIQGLGTHT